MEAKRTKQCRALKWIFKLLHILLLFGPFLYFVPYCYSTGTRGEVVGLSAMLVVGVILLVFSIITDVKHRAGLHKAILWILIGGVSLCLKELDAFIWIMIIVSIADELIVCPLAAHYATALIANKEIDKRS